MGRTTRLLAAQFSTSSRWKLILILGLDAALGATGVFFIRQYLRHPGTAYATHPESASPGSERHGIEPESRPRPNVAEVGSDRSAIGKSRLKQTSAGGRTGRPTPSTLRSTARNDSHGTEAEVHNRLQESDTATLHPQRRNTVDAAVDQSSSRNVPSPTAARQGSMPSTARPTIPGKEEGSQDRSRYAARLKRIFRKTRNRMKRCYQEALKLHGRKIAGSVHLRFELREDGSVSRVVVVRNTTGSIQLERCLLALAGKLRFPKPPGGATAFLYPVAFKAKP